MYYKNIIEHVFMLKKIFQLLNKIMLILSQNETKDAVNDTGPPTDEKPDFGATGDRMDARNTTIPETYSHFTFS